MLPSWMSLSGNEIINSARAAAYAQAHGIPVQCGGCPDLAFALGDAPYGDSPRTDDAPWYDPTRPASGRFLGVLGLGVQGFAAATVERTPTPLVGDGSALGPSRRPARETVWTLLLVAMDDEALDYGYEYLASALRAGVCDATSCSGDTMCVLSGCPDPGTDSYGQLRTLYDVGVLDGVAETERQYLSGAGQCDTPAGCCSGSGLRPVLAQASVTMVAGVPYVYREPIPVGTAWTDLTQGTVIARFDPEAQFADCPTPTSCLDDPTCKAPALPPAVPVPASPCWTSGPFTARRSWITASPLLLPQWGEVVPVVQVTTGTKEMRKLIIRFTPNPAGLDCATRGADACGACTQVAVAYLPANSTLTLDGRTGKAVVDCSGGAGQATSTPALYGAGGEQFQWPVFECPTGFCIEVISASAVGDGAQARVLMVPRGDAS